MSQQMPQFNFTLTAAGVNVVATGAAAVYFSIGISLTLVLLGFVAEGSVYCFCKASSNVFIRNPNIVTIKHGVAAGSATLVATGVSAVSFSIEISLVLGIVAGGLVYYFCKRHGKYRSFENTPSS